MSVKFVDPNEAEDIMPGWYDEWVPLLAPRLNQISARLSAAPIEFTISQKTWDRLETGDDTVYAEIEARYKNAIGDGLGSVEL